MRFEKGDPAFLEQRYEVEVDGVDVGQHHLLYLPAPEADAAIPALPAAYRLPWTAYIAFRGSKPVKNGGGDNPVVAMEGATGNLEANRWLR